MTIENISLSSADSSSVSQSERSRSDSGIGQSNVSNDGRRIYGYDDEEDLQSGEVDREYSGVFEGPEKTLEVCFRRPQPTTGGEVLMDEIPSADGKLGMRKLVRQDLDRICRRARCTILSSISNNHLDAYVLSESSLFVYPYVVVLKTCGTTTLLRCIATIIELGKRVGLEIDWVGYSRKNFNFPWVSFMYGWMNEFEQFSFF